jgi:Zn-finger nucleic acid-binding protein
MADPRNCPDCRTPMQSFWLPAKGGGAEVELDRCTDCGGVWFDAGELSQATGRQVTASRAAVSRLCPSCRVPLMHGTLQGDIGVETCARCKGTFLEARDLEALKKRASSLSAPGGSGFVCEECGKRKAFSDGHATLTGLVCTSCAEVAEPPPPVKEEARSTFSSFLGWLRGD